MKTGQTLVIQAMAVVSLGFLAVGAQAETPAWESLLNACEKADLAACNNLLESRTATGSIHLLALMGRGKIFYDKRMFEKSYADFAAADALVTELLRTRPSPAIVHVQSLAQMWLAKIHNNLGQYEDAIAAADKALESDPQNSYALAARGIAYQKQNKTELALKDFSRVLTIDPNRISIRMRRATILHETDPGKGDEDYRFVEASPDSDEYNRRMAHLMLNMRSMPEKDIERELAALEGQATPPDQAIRRATGEGQASADSGAVTGQAAPPLDEKQLGEDIFVYEGLVKLCAPDTSISPADTDRVIHVFQARGGGDFAVGARGASDALLAAGPGESGCSPKLRHELQVRQSRIERAMPAVLAFRQSFKPKGCGFAVAFPGPPQIRTLSLPNGMTFPQAELLFGGKVFRAECIAAPMSRDDAARMQLAQASADVLQAAALKDISDTVTELRGYKIISGESAVYITRVYRGQDSTLTVVVGSKSADIPMAATLFREVSEIK